MTENIGDFPEHFGSGLAARKLQVSGPTLRRLARAGFIEFLLVGERMMFTEAALARYLEQAKVPAVTIKSA